MHFSPFLIPLPFVYPEETRVLRTLYTLEDDTVATYNIINVNHNLAATLDTNPCATYFLIVQFVRLKWRAGQTCQLSRPRVAA